MGDYRPFSKHVLVIYVCLSCAVLSLSVLFSGFGLSFVYLLFTIQLGVRGRVFRRIWSFQEDFKWNHTGH